jgi:hypothetical protein
MSSNIDALSDDLKLLLKEWPETLEIFKEAKEETNSSDLFATIEYLSFCDQFCKAIHGGLKIVNVYLFELQKNPTPSDSLVDNYRELKSNMQVKMQNIGKEYEILAEATLRRVQDTIAIYASAIQNERPIPSFSVDISQDVYLQELRNILELYRQEREDFVLELEKDLKQQLPNTDPVLSQLNTTITECDTALLIKEIEE